MKKLQRAMSAARQGFTLVELLVVIGILAILTAVVLVAVNPGRQLAQARNTQRRADVNTILTAITAYMADPVNNGVPPATITAICPAIQTIGTTASPVFADLSVVKPTYVADIPMDPTNGTAADTGYTVCSTGAAAAYRMTVVAPGAELSEVITVTR